MTLRGPQFDVEGRGWPYRHASRFVEHPAGRIHVLVLGAGPVVLLIHGTGASAHSFRELVPLLLPRFTVVALDLPGQGFSSCHDAFEPTVQGMASVLADVMLELSLTPRVVVGHSSGAAVAVVLALHEEDAAAVRAPRPGAEAGPHGAPLPIALVVGLSAALLPLEGITGALMRATARVLAPSALVARALAWRARRPGSVERLVRSTGSVIDDVGIDLYRRLAGTPRHVAGVLRMLAAWDPETAFDALPRLRTNTLFIGGARDRATPVEEQRRAVGRILGAVFHTLGGAGHLAHEEDPRAVAALIHEAADRAGLPPARADGGTA